MLNTSARESTEEARSLVALRRSLDREPELESWTLSRAPLSGGRQSAFNRLSPKKRGLRRFPEGGTPYTGPSLDVSEKVWVAHAARSVRSHRNMAQSRISPEGSASGSLSSGFTNIVEPILDPSAGCPPLILRHVGVLLPKTLTFGNGGLCGILRRGIGAPRIGPATRGRGVSCVRVCGLRWQ